MDSYKDQKSMELTELRTVLSRSKTAYDTLRQHNSQKHSVEERLKMIGDLAMVISYLEKYEGHRKSWHQSMRERRDGN
jgi:hypothetical protein